MLKNIFLGILTAYQAILRAFLGPSCRFSPTCSEYAREAVERYGVWRGGWLGMKRLSRCHPWSGKSGYDPVPVSLPSKS